MHFPIKHKPSFDFSEVPITFEYQNIISKDMASDIINQATSHPGWHRRGSKTSFTNASFTTTLLSDTTHPIYSILDNLWKQFIDEHNFEIEFVEPYEVKEYITGDRFDNHYDWHGRVHEPLDRKMNLIIQLSDSSDYEGGDLVVINENVSREIGTAIFFPAHYIHRITPVLSGKRYSLIGHAWGMTRR